MAEFQKAIRIKPEYVIAYNNLGSAYERSGLTDKAIETYLRGLYHDPSNIVLHSNLGSAYLKKEKLEQAYWEFQKVLSLYARSTPGDNIRSDLALIQLEMDRDLILEVHYNLGLVFEGERKIDLAIRQYKTVLEMKPDHKEAKDHLYRLIK